MLKKMSAMAVASFAVCMLSINVYPQGSALTPADASVSSPLKRELEHGYRLKEQKRTSEALEVFQNVVKRDPGNKVALIELGYLNVSLKHYKSAVKYFEAASAQDPSNIRLHMDLGYAFQALKQNESAGNQFKIAAASPGEFQVQAKEALENVSSSPANANQADVKQLHLREHGYAALNRGDRTAARQAFEAAVANNPKDEAALKQLGFINLEDGNLPAAVANFEAIRTLDPADYFVALQLGYTYESLQKKEQAREAFNTALASTDVKIHDAAQAALQSSGGVSVPAVNTSL